MTYDYVSEIIEIQVIGRYSCELREAEFHLPVFRHTPLINTRRKWNLREKQEWVFPAGVVARWIEHLRTASCSIRTQQQVVKTTFGFGFSRPIFLRRLLRLRLKELKRRTFWGCWNRTFLQTWCRSCRTKQLSKQWKDNTKWVRNVSNSTAVITHRIYQCFFY